MSSYGIKLNSDTNVEMSSLGQPLAQPYLDFEKTSKTYQVVTTHPGWAHTIGRISNAARIPFLLLSAAFQIVLLPFKLLTTFFTDVVGRCIYGKEVEKTEGYQIARDFGANIYGLGDSVIRLLKTIDRTYAAALNVVHAPSKGYESFGAEMIDIFDIGGILTDTFPAEEVQKYLKNVSENGPVALQSFIKINESCMEPKAVNSQVQNKTVKSEDPVTDATRTKNKLLIPDSVSAITESSEMSDKLQPPGTTQKALQTQNGITSDLSGKSKAKIQKEQSNVQSISTSADLNPPMATPALDISLLQPIAQEQNSGKNEFEKQPALSAEEEKTNLDPQLEAQFKRTKTTQERIDPALEKNFKEAKERIEALETTRKAEKAAGLKTSMGKANNEIAALEKKLQDGELKEDHLLNSALTTLDELAQDLKFYAPEKRLASTQPNQQISIEVEEQEKICQEHAAILENVASLKKTISQKQEALQKTRAAFLQAMKEANITITSLEKKVEHLEKKVEQGKLKGAGRLNSLKSAVIILDSLGENMQRHAQIVLPKKNSGSKTPAQNEVRQPITEDVALTKLKVQYQDLLQRMSVLHPKILKLQATSTQTSNTQPKAKSREIKTSAAKLRRTPISTPNSLTGTTGAPPEPGALPSDKSHPAHPESSPELEISIIPLTSPVVTSLLPAEILTQEDKQ